MPAHSVTGSTFSLFSNRLLASNTIINLVGLAAPIPIGIFAVPLLIDAIGLERLGALTLVWSVLGFFALLDLGLGRALTNTVAELMGANRNAEIPSTIWTGIGLMALLGLLGSGLLALLAHWLVGSAPSIPNSMRGEIVHATYALCLTLPFVVTAAGLRGVLEATQSFRLIAALRIFFALAAFWGPLLVAKFSVSLLFLTIPICLARLAAWIVLGIAIKNRFPAIAARPLLDVGKLRSLLSFGLWMAVSNTLSPLLVNLDRYVLAGMTSLAAVAFYATPFDVVTKILIVPSAICGVLFSALSATISQDAKRANSLYSLATAAAWLSLFPLVLAIMAFARELLSAWVSAEFAAQSYQVAQIIAFGVLINGMTHLPFAALQAARRPDLTAMVHLLEIVPFVVLLLILVGKFGIEGAAIAWTTRVIVDFAAITYLARRHTSLSIEFGLVEIFIVMLMLSTLVSLLFELGLAMRVLAISAGSLATLALARTLVLKWDSLAKQ